jgi:dihydrofolate reductase
MGQFGLYAGRNAHTASRVEIPRVAPSHGVTVLFRRSERRTAAGDRTEARMRNLIVNEWMTLDGVVQAPSYTDEDATGGFTHGGWHTRYFDELSMNWVIDTVRGAGGFLLGRGTYEMFAAHWPNAPEDQQVLAEPLNALPKYVASTALDEPLGWQNSRLLRGDIGEAVRALKAEDGHDLHVIGSPGLVPTLIARGLVDELQLMIDPVVVGGGKRLFRDDGVRWPLRQVDCKVTTTGAIIATYAAMQ